MPEIVAKFDQILIKIDHPEQNRSASDRRVNWLYSTTCATGAQHAYAAVAEVPVRPCSGGC